MTLLSLTISIACGVLIYGTIDLFIPLLGNKWLDSSDMVKNLIPLFMTSLFTYPTMNFLRFINKTRIQLLIEVIEVLIKITFLLKTNFPSAGELVFYYGLMSGLFAIFKTTLVYVLFTRPSSLPR